MSKALNFRISSALKDIIGRDLIPDDFIAVFELVKNSFDAHATRVDIKFENIYSDDSRIVIQDDGKGMDKSDILNKWLFVAYSAKKEGTEDNNFDYRDGIYSNRPFAGAKGIGRFSCDRLGELLHLESKKKAANSKLQIVDTDWKLFEQNIKDEFIEVSVEYSESDRRLPPKNHGTVLTISKLRSSWDRDKLLKLRDSLAKLINPKRAKGEKSFSIVITVPEELEHDERQTKQHKRVNGEIKNFIFDSLGLKTTRIEVEVSRGSENGGIITTSLIDGGTLIYSVKEPNNFRLLHNISFRLYYLNKAAKLTFAKRMGLASRRFGHVFLYKNGFRIYPFGEPFEDPLRIEERKSRRENSRLGTSELIGEIEIFGENHLFQETSSRGSGLIKNEAYHQLEQCFLVVLERLEKYVVDVQKWGLSIEDQNADVDLKSRAVELISQLTDSTEIIDFSYSNDFIDIILNVQSESAQALINSIEKIAVDTGNSELSKIARRASNRLVELRRAKEEAEREALRAQQEAEAAQQEAINAQKTAEIAQQELEVRVSENLFLRSIKSQEIDEIVSLMHHIGIYAGTVDNYLSAFYRRLGKGKSIESDELLEIIKVVSFEIKKIINISKFATKANFKLSTETLPIDVGEYIGEYISNILPTVTDKRLSISFHNKIVGKPIRDIKPIELNIIIDNLISNARKASATEVSISTAENNGKIAITVNDNGEGMAPQNINRIFDFGYTTSSGSGLGLFHVKQILDSLDGTITVESALKKGTTFTITI